jgi:hypothetical protein
VRIWLALIWVVVSVVAIGCRSRAHDAGSAVAALSMLDVPAASGAMAPFLRDDGDGALATWLEPMSGGGGHRLRVARWQGAAWRLPTTITESAAIVASWADVPTIARGGGALVASWAETMARAGTYDARVGRSTDDGATWTPLGALHADRTPAEHGFVSMVPDGAVLRAFWLDGRDAEAGGATALRTAVVGDAITGEAVVDDRVCDCCPTAAVATDAGSLVTFRDRSDGEIRDIAIARAAGDAWKPAALSSDGWQITGCPVNGPAIAAHGRAVAVAWFTRAHDAQRVRVAFSSDGGASFTPSVDVDEPAGDRAPIGRVAIVLDDNGSAIVSWVATTSSALTVLVRRITPTGGRGPELPIAHLPSGREVGVPRIARAGATLLALWTDPTPPAHLQAARLPLSAVPAAGP